VIRTTHEQDWIVCVRLKARKPESLSHWKLLSDLFPMHRDEIPVGPFRNFINVTRHLLSSPQTQLLSCILIWFTEYVRDLQVFRD